MTERRITNENVRLGAGGEMEYLSEGGVWNTRSQILERYNVICLVGTLERSGHLRDGSHQYKWLKELNLTDDEINNILASE